MSNELKDLKLALRTVLPYRTESDEVDEAIMYLEQRIQTLIEESPVEVA